MKPICLIDMDLTIADANKAFIQGAKKQFNVHIPEKDTLKYIGDHEVFAPLTNEMIAILLSQQGFFSSLEPIKGARAALNRLKKRFEIYIVSAPYPNNPTSYHEKYVWLKTYFHGFEDKLVGTFAKEAIAGNVLIDDHMAFCKKWKKHYPYGLVASLRYPWTDQSIVDIDELTWHKLADRLLSIKFAI